MRIPLDFGLLLRLIAASDYAGFRPVVTFHLGHRLPSIPATPEEDKPSDAGWLRGFFTARSRIDRGLVIGSLVRIALIFTPKSVYLDLALSRLKTCFTFA